jgi:hypothetical protein
VVVPAQELVAGYAVRIAVDVCVSSAVELELWRAGYQVPVRAGTAEPDEQWISRAVRAGCKVAITMDRGAAQVVRARGMVSVLVPGGTPGHKMPTLVFDALEKVEEVYRGLGKPATILAPLLAVGIALLAACGAAPQALAAPAPKPTPWCFAAVALFDGRDQAAVGCFETEQLCGNAQRRALRWGGMAKLRAVGACEGRP